MSCGRVLGRVGDFAEVWREALWTSTSRHLPTKLSWPQSGTETSHPPHLLILKLLLVPKLHIKAQKADRTVCFESCRSLLWQNHHI